MRGSIGDGFLSIMGMIVSVVALIGLAVALVAVYESAQASKFRDKEAQRVCRKVCGIVNGVRRCVSPCPGPRCVCEQDENGVFYLEKSSSGSE